MQTRSTTSLNLYGLLATLLFLAASLVHAAPDLANTTNTNAIHDRDLAAIELQVEGDISFTSCIPSKYIQVCTLFYTTNSQQWGPHAYLQLYEDTCTELSNSQYISRDAIAWPGNRGGKTMGWEYTEARVRYPLYVWVSSDWDGTNPDPAANNGVGIVYNGTISNLLYDNMNGASYWASLPGIKGGRWAWWRAQFECGVYGEH
ncbi:hypothetical protein BDZ45DRAFT_61190 [Acephala macrosclerotiorum]|nr:hypothetical protein BDZ45DRAFT_61190 [Acephala macrosclerotiorum]